MERAVYDRMARNEATHWWFAGRRTLIECLIRQLHLPGAAARILEVGCGTGGNLPLLKTLGQVEAVECDAEARRIAELNTGVRIAQGELPDQISPPCDVYDLVVLLDVLEHVDEDVRSLATLARALRPEGRILITVPALPWLWSAHDEAHHHKRRYTAASLGRTIDGAGLRVDGIGYFNFLLFPLALIMRTLKGILGIATPDDALPAPLVNQALSLVFSAERHLIGKVPMPIGLSVYAIASRR
jgi:SAM-dependent methyltransferase